MSRLPPDSDDGIPLDGFDDKPKRRPKPAKPLHKPTGEDPTAAPRCGPCWVCQRPTFSDKCAKVAGRILPVCISCWKSIPPAERVRVGLQLIATDDARPLQQVAALILARIKGDAERAIDGEDGLFGMFSTGN